MVLRNPNTDYWDVNFSANKHICSIFKKLPLAEEHSTANKSCTTSVCHCILAFIHTNECLPQGIVPQHRSRTWNESWLTSVPLQQHPVCTLLGLGYRQKEFMAWLFPSSMLQALKNRESWWVWLKHKIKYLKDISAKDAHSRCIHVIYNLSGNQGGPSWDNHNGR